MSSPEDQLHDLFNEWYSTNAPVRQYELLELRKFRFDFAFPALKLAVEMDGINHRRWHQCVRDREKDNLAAMHGWIVLRFVPDDLKDPPHIHMVVSKVIELRISHAELLASATASPASG